jgi:hypothetical protein
LPLPLPLPLPLLLLPQLQLPPPPPLLLLLVLLSSLRNGRPVEKLRCVLFPVVVHAAPSHCREARPLGGKCA